MPSRGRAGGTLYFEALREAAGRLADGLVRLGPPASSLQIGDAERELGRQLPRDYAELLRSFNGVDLFGEGVVLLGVGDSPLGTLLSLNRSRAGRPRRR